MSIETRALRRVVVALNRTQFVCGRRKSSLPGYSVPTAFHVGKPSETEAETRSARGANGGSTHCVSCLAARLDIRCQVCAAMNSPGFRRKFDFWGET